MCMEDWLRKKCPSAPLQATVCTWPRLILKLGLTFTVWDSVLSQHCLWGLTSSGLWCSLLDIVLPSTHVPSHGSTHSPFSALLHPSISGSSRPEGYKVCGPKVIFISPLGGSSPKYLHFSRLRWNLNMRLLFSVERCFHFVLAAITCDILRGIRIWRCAIRYSCQHDNIKCFMSLIGTVVFMTGHHISLILLATGQASCCHSCELSLFYIRLCWVKCARTNTHTQLFPHVDLQMLYQDADFLTWSIGAILVHYVRCTSWFTTHSVVYCITYWYIMYVAHRDSLHIL